MEFKKKPCIHTNVGHSLLSKPSVTSIDCLNLVDSLFSKRGLAQTLCALPGPFSQMGFGHGYAAEDIIAGVLFR
jgi:hypothetical protein